jgi:GntR family transcriptional regulator
MARDATVVDLSRSAVSRYIQLATLFRSRIASATWRSGERIPTVDELAAQHGVARATIRQALDQLEAEGLIERFRAKGTFVRAAPQRLWCEVETDWSGLLRSRDGALIEILSDSPGLAAADIPRATIGTLAPSYRHIRRRHSRDGQAFLLADVFLDDRLSSLVTAEDLTTRTALRLAASIPGVKISDARQVLTIGSADVESAAALGIALNAPVAHVRRAAVDQHGTLILVADGLYRGDLVRLDVKLR